MATTITLELGGCVNGAAVDLSGRAALDLGAGRLELELASRGAPLHWSPVLGLLGLLDAVQLLAAVGGLGGEGLTTAFLRRRAGLCDDQGHELGEEVLSLVVRAQEGGGFACRGQYLAGNARMEPVERARKIVEACPTVAMPCGDSSILLAGAARFETDWGNHYRVAGHEVAEVNGGELPEGAVEVRLVDGEMARSGGAVERMRFGCGVELRGVHTVALPPPVRR